MLIQKAIKLKLFPTEAQVEQIEKTFGCRRFVYNNFLAKVKIDNEKYKSYYQNSKELTSLKQTPDLNFLKDVDKFSLQNALKDLDDAFSRFFKKQNKFPKFKRKAENNNNSYTTNFTNNNIELGKNFLKLPKLKKVKTNKKINLNYVVKINSVTVKKINHSYYAMIQVEYKLVLKEIQSKIDEPINYIIGGDLGIKEFITLSTGEVRANPKYLIANQNKLAKLQRKVSKCVKGSNNENKLFKRISKLQGHTSNSRLDFQHKLSKKLVNENQVIVLETLSVKSMIKSKKLSKHIQDAAWGQFVSLVKYKAIWYGRTLIQAPTNFASSQLCNKCNYKNPIVRDLKIRKWTCPSCKTNHDRDLNAAINLKKFGLNYLKTI